VYEILGVVRRAMRVDGVDDWNREWMMDGQVLLRFLFPGSEGIAATCSSSKLP
jgi:hypothetical protein